MVVDKESSLKPILASQGGLHLTAYLVNRGDVEDLQSQLRQSLREAKAWLSEVLPPDELKKFLEPFQALQKETRLLANVRGNIALFRNLEGFRMLALPVEVERLCVVATTFHVKPLLRWIQSDHTFLLLGFHANEAHLYLGNQNAFQKIGMLPVSTRRPHGHLEAWLKDYAKSGQTRLFLAGDPTLTNPYEALGSPVAADFREESVGRLCAFVRRLLRIEEQIKIQESLIEFRIAEERRLATNNIFRIAESASRGEVRKLIVADRVSIFGKMDPRTGALSLHPFDLDHEDDDLLDDLAQTVLARGGEVVVAPIDSLPNAKPALAILKSPAHHNELKGLSA